MAHARVFLLYCGIHRSLSIGGQVLSSVLPGENIGDRSQSWHLMDALAVHDNPEALQGAARVGWHQARQWALDHDLVLNLTGPLDSNHPRGPGTLIRFGAEALLVDRQSMSPIIRAYDLNIIIDLRQNPEWLPEKGFGEDLASKLARLDELCAIESATEPPMGYKGSPRI